MSTTTKKHSDFVAEPMVDKPVTALPGVGKVNGKHLADAGITKASQVVGMYLAYGKDEDKFTEWVQKNGCMNNKQARDCVKAVQEWTDQHA